ncbi:hypothetical protein HLB23_28875 [Nocardia uniformis]|uniref:Uncharacterized protein n=1 Tax=Nocardia uniformis TaxID=53432 RepID=A0A849CBT7_9NOCA|nr:hypothetical protein [Nocardia uniformis]NNH73820.1 hypothetical protein [Nocardia uniformis]
MGRGHAAANNEREGPVSITGAGIDPMMVAARTSTSQVVAVRTLTAPPVSKQDLAEDERLLTARWSWTARTPSDG